jgi:hypothetical protein
MSIPADDLPSQAECTCVPVADGVALTGGCPEHDPVLRLLDGEPVKFCGIPVIPAPPAYKWKPLG